MPKLIPLSSSSAPRSSRSPVQDTSIDSFYRVVYGCRDDDPLQRELNALYNYDQDVNTRIMHRIRLNSFVTLVKELIADGTIRQFDAALDIGCNAGIYSKIISEFGFRRVVGVDIAPESIETARPTFGSSAPDRSIEFLVKNAEELDPSLGPFDFLLTTEVIEHTEHPERTIDVLPGLLAPGGIAVISFPNAASLPFIMTYLFYKLRGKGISQDLHDHMSFPFWRALRLMEKTGLRVVRTSGANLLPGGFLLRSLYRAPGFPELNRLNAQISRQWPVKYFAQHLYIVLRKD